MATAKTPAKKVATKAPAKKEVVKNTDSSKTNPQPKFQLSKPAVKKPAAKTKTALAASAMQKAKPSVKQIKETASKLKPTPVKKAPVKKPVAKPAPVPAKAPENKVTSVAPWDAVPQEKAVETPPAPTGFPLIPVMHEGFTSNSYFSKVFDHSVEVDGKPYALKTGYLSMHRTVDIMGLSQHQEFLDAGFITPTDVLDPNIVLASLHLVIGGEDKFVNTLTLHGANFVVNPNGNYREMTIEIVVLVKHNDKTSPITVTGNINSEVGSAYLTSKSHPDISVKGFMLDAKRINPNRR